MTRIDLQTALACLALIIMGCLSAALIFYPVPTNNMQLVTFALGAISGALTVGGGAKVADHLTSGGPTTINNPTPGGDPAPLETKP